MTTVTYTHEETVGQRPYNKQIAIAARDSGAEALVLPEGQSETDDPGLRSRIGATGTILP